MYRRIILNTLKLSLKTLKIAQSCLLFATPWTIACQAALSIEFSRQEYWSGYPYPSPGGSSQPRDWTWVSHIAGRFFTVWATKEAFYTLINTWLQRSVQCPPGPKPHLDFYFFKLEHLLVSSSSQTLLRKLWFLPCLFFTVKQKHYLNYLCFLFTSD